MTGKMTAEEARRGLAELYLKMTVEPATKLASATGLPDVTVSTVEDVLAFWDRNLDLELEFVILVLRSACGIETDVRAELAKGGTA